MIERLKAALEALESSAHAHTQHEGLELEAAITDLQAVIAEMEAGAQVATVYSFNDLGGTFDWVSPPNYRPPVGAKLYAHPQPGATAYAKRLAKSIYTTHYREQAPQWECADDLLTVLSQIDNMVAGLTNTKSNPSEADELLQNLGLNPEQYRTDGGAINYRKVKAAILHPDEYPVDGTVEILQAVNRFLGWKLPKEFCPDSFISFDREKHSQWGGYPNSWPTGTNLLTADQAREMFEYCFEQVAQPKAEPVQEPVAWPDKCELDQTPLGRAYSHGWNECLADCKRAVHTHPQPKAEQGRVCKVGGDCVAGKTTSCACLEMSAIAQPKAEPEPAAFETWWSNEGSMETRMRAAIAAATKEQAK